MRMRIPVFTILLPVLTLPGSAQQPPKVVEQDGHLSPLHANITFPNGRERKVLLLGIGRGRGDQWLTHGFTVRTEGGSGKRRIWLDSLAKIFGTSEMRTVDSEFTITFKDGKDLFAGFSKFWGACDGEEPRRVSTTLRQPAWKFSVFLPLSSRRAAAVC